MGWLLPACLPAGRPAAVTIAYLASPSVRSLKRSCCKTANGRADGRGRTACSARGQEKDRARAVRDRPTEVESYPRFQRRRNPRRLRDRKTCLRMTYNIRNLVGIFNAVLIQARRLDVFVYGAYRPPRAATCHRLLPPLNSRRGRMSVRPSVRRSLSSLLLSLPSSLSPYSHFFSTDVGASRVNERATAFYFTFSRSRRERESTVTGLTC